MTTLFSKNFNSPDETKTPEKTKVEVVKVGDQVVSKITFQPGWKWSECIKPAVGTDSCQKKHVGMVQSGRIHVVNDDGSSIECGPGDAYVFLPGHDGWVVGDEECVCYEFESDSAATYGSS
tara:strand:- start:272 stop:634 length:363 start_codon:yes stop_codon:yes gene_type:complete